MLPATSVARTRKVWPAFGEAGVALRARARGVAAAVDLALEGRASLGRAEGEACVRGRRRVRGIGVDRRVGGDAVDRERAARGRLDEIDVVGRAHADRVGAVGREARGGEGVGPVPAGKGCRVPDLAARAERAGAPVVARALADRDLDLLDARRRVGVRAAEAVRARSPRSSRTCCSWRPSWGSSPSRTARSCRPSTCSSPPKRPCFRPGRSRARGRCGSRRRAGQRSSSGSCTRSSRRRRAGTRRSSCPRST